MIRTSKKCVALLSVILGLTQFVKAQTTIQIVYENGKLSADSTSYTFDVRAIRGMNYDVANADSSNWQYMNLRSNIQVPVGVTILANTSYVPNQTYSSGGGISNNPPGPLPNDGGNWAKFSVNLTRTIQNDIPPGNGAILGTGTLNFSGKVLPSNQITIRPYNGSNFNAFWTNLEIDLAMKRIVGTANLALPVKLVDFSAAREGNTATLAWSTSEESNSDYFEVQRSGDAKAWEKLKSVVAKGESTVEAHYSAVDESPMGGKNLYRLKMVDKDGTFAFSTIKNVEFDLKMGYTLFPNPVSEKLSFKSTEDWNNITSIKIYNAQGVEVYTSPSVPAKEVNVKHLPSGTYVVKLSKRRGQSNSYKVIIAR
ncbi:Por secretion system C-terminal sorting domain-containing protein [Dyadobacter soli]|uniref:Por secretion system C-terminal sorting domain-containing protein n=1 Tax=Dyadobacter soli TaxID=659014 RepID=A0A1G6XW14_9BACT|nr:T9SS type A sorting domain-containing protein [Dyadobacter soli]SDD81617.1 Por secretion system C-terminal sorting domain-containing protein [Dyadobacter soli]